MEKYISKFKKGPQYANIVSPVDETHLTEVKTITDRYLDHSCLKFIPASGAATRMFKELYTFLETKEETTYTDTFFEHLESFAFYDDIAGDLKTIETLEDKCRVVELVLDKKLNYGNLPKALIKMHDYKTFKTTPIDEHIYEGEAYVNKEVNLHFTISKDHEVLFNAYIEPLLKEKEYLDITYSFQKKHTDMLAVELNNEPFRLASGDILFRPGGHGALIENLNDLQADIIFIKNVDNVCHRSLADTTISSKRMLASAGLEVKEQIDTFIKAIKSNHYDLKAIATFIDKSLNITLKEPLTVSKALKLLDRPLRVCGVVKNQGEPGGGPFLVDNGDYIDLQVCEMVEIDLTIESNKALLSGAKYFNPTDLVCFTKDYKNEKYNLLDYVNKDRYFITEKSYKGRTLKALEHPGLWNGSMHHWNTLFVEIPLTTFNPVKNVNDLLRQGHVGI